MAAESGVKSAEIQRLARSDAPPGQRLGWIRAKLGLTQEELGSSIGVSGVSILKYELGQAVPSDRVKTRLARRTGIPVEDWVTWAAREDGAEAGVSGEAA